MLQTSQSVSEDREPDRKDSVSLDCESGRILLASEGRPISPAAVAKAARLAIENHAKVHVLSVARIWGSAFGLPHPGLMPTARELQFQRDIVAAAIDELERQGIDCTGEVLRSRDAAKAIAAKLRQGTYLEIVMGADPEPHWLVRGIFWSHEPYRVRRLIQRPIHLVVDTPEKPNLGQGSSSPKLPDLRLDY
jgi:nucleotide-binding universal stress UspA family protein